MKKIIAVILSVALLLFTLTACSSTTASAANDTSVEAAAEKTETMENSAEELSGKQIVRLCRAGGRGAFVPVAAGQSLLIDLLLSSSGLDSSKRII